MDKRKINKYYNYIIYLIGEFSEKLGNIFLFFCYFPNEIYRFMLASCLKMIKADKTHYLKQQILSTKVGSNTPIFGVVNPPKMCATNNSIAFMQ